MARHWSDSDIATNSTNDDYAASSWNKWLNGNNSWRNSEESLLQPMLEQSHILQNNYEALVLLHFANLFKTPTWKQSPWNTLEDSSHWASGLFRRSIHIYILNIIFPLITLNILLIMTKALTTEELGFLGSFQFVPLCPDMAGVSKQLVVSHISYTPRQCNKLWMELKLPLRIPSFVSLASLACWDAGFTSCTIPTHRWKPRLETYHHVSFMKNVERRNKLTVDSWDQHWNCLRRWKKWTERASLLNLEPSKKTERERELWYWTNP